MVQDIQLIVESNPSEADTIILRKGIVDFNASCIHEKASQFCVFARDEKNTIIGGASVWQHSDAFYIDILWIEENFRKKSIGTRLINEIFAQARLKNLKQIFVDTFDFQAFEFYKRQGFYELGRIEKYLLGHDRIYLKKELKI